MLMPGRRGAQVGGGWADGGSSGSGVPQSLSVESRDASVGEYKASQEITFEPGFGSTAGDAFLAEITQSSGGTGGSGGFSTAGGGYRYGFNGKEWDSEIKGEGAQQDYGMRIYDSRLSKFLSVDPLTKQYPELTPYQFASNSPIAGVDLDGLEFYYAADGTYLGKSKNGGTQLRIATKYEMFDDRTTVINSYKEYRTNSEYSRLGRNEAGKSLIQDKINKDFTGVRTLSNDEVGRILAFGRQVFKNAPALASDLGAVYRESVGRKENGNYGLLDFKFVAYDLLGIDRNNLLEIEGTVYSPGEAGNFLWSMVLAYEDVPGAALIAELGTKGRNDEPYDQKAINEGDVFGEKLDKFGSKNPVKISSDRYLKSGQSKKDVSRVAQEHGHK